MQSELATAGFSDLYFLPPRLRPFQKNLRLLFPATPASTIAKNRSFRKAAALVRHSSGPGQISGYQLGISSGGNHGGVIGGKLPAREKYRQAAAASAWRANVNRSSRWRLPRRKPGPSAHELVRRVEGAADEFGDDCALEAGQKFEGAASCIAVVDRAAPRLPAPRLAARGHLGIQLGVGTKVVQDRGLNSAEAEVVGVDP